MKRGLKKLLGFMPACVRDFFEMVFSSAAELHIKIAKSGQPKYRSYTQLKRHQKKVRKSMTVSLLVLLSLLLGMAVGPIFFPQLAESEVYIPNGKGDILVSNVSKNQATVIFKTLDSANGNMPLATKATVEFYEDPQLTDLVRRSTEQDYAVTHIVPVDSLQEEKIYYIKIIAKDGAEVPHTKEVSSWGGQNESIKVFTSGELIPTCATEKNIPNQPVAAEVEVEEKALPSENNTEKYAATLQIDNIQNENYLQPGNKVQTIISWMTNMPASTVVTYGEEKSGEKKQINVSDKLETKHMAVLTTLKTGSTYYFTVESKDAAGKIVTSEEYSLRTPRAQENVIQKISNNFKEILLQIKPR